MLCSQTTMQRLMPGSRCKIFAITFLTIQQTVYGWTSNRTIPYHKNGKSILFRKSEIDNWLMQASRKSVNDIYDEARAYVTNNPKGRKEVTRYHV